MAQGMLGSLPPGLRGMLAAEQMGQQRSQNQLGQIGGILGLQNAMAQQQEMQQGAPLRQAKMQAELDSLQNPAPTKIDLGGAWGLMDRTGNIVATIPKTASPDTMAKEQGAMTRHEQPSGSAVLGERGAMQRHLSPSGSTLASNQVSMRGQNMTDARSREALDAGRWTNDLTRGIQVNTATGETRPITQGGAPLAPAPSESQKKELMGIGQQEATVKGALDAVLATPSAFGLKRGAATMAGAIPESLAGRLDSSDERAARSYVFNVVSKVINERAGAAQSAQELARLRSFLPAEMDSADQIKDKLTGFQTYLGDMRSGTTGQQQRRSTDNAKGWSIRPAN